MKRKLRYYLNQEIPLLVLQFILSTILAVCITVSVYVWKIIYDNLFKQPDQTLFLYIIIISLFATLLTHIFTVFKDIITGLLNRRMRENIRKDFILEIMHYRYRFFLKKNTGEFIKRATEDCRLIANGLTNRITGVINLLQVIFWLVFFLFFIPWISVIYLGLLILLITWIYVWKSKYELSIYEINKSFDTFWKNLWEIFSSVKMIKLELLKLKVINNMDTVLEGKRQKFKINIRYKNLIWNIFILLPWLAAGAILFAASKLMMQGNFSIGMLVFCFLFVERFLSPLNELVNIIIAMESSKAAYRRLTEYLVNDTEKEGRLTMPPLQQLIEFKNVSFSYKDSHFKLNNIDLSVPKGKNIAITGISGCGKSTIASLLVRLFDPQNGKILIDNIDHTAFSLASLRKEILFLPQEIPIYNATLRENIDISHQLNDAEIISLIYQVNLMPFYEKTTLGLDTVLAEEGLDISGGERQRLGIARALGHSPSVFIFDEITANLDKLTEIRIAELIYRQNKNYTTITITHSPDLLKFMDIIYGLKNGCIKELTHEVEMIAE